MRFTISLIAVVLLYSGVLAAQDEMPVILSMSDRANVIDNWLQIRLDKVVPALMRREGIDMWVIIAREYNEDPVIETMLPAKWYAARRRTILLFFDRGEEEGVERLAVSRYAIGNFFKSSWNPEEQPDQWKCLADLIAQKNPKKIALNFSKTFALADGLSQSQYEEFRTALPGNLRDRIVSGERLAIGWLETRIAQEMVVYPAICRLAHKIIAEGLSNKVIQAGVTTTEDVQWWYLERIHELKLKTWFHPSVSIQRAGQQRPDNLAQRSEPKPIMPGDLIHIDFGITYLGLNTDTQQHAYVLKPGETDAPEGLKKALAQGNRLQDILLSQYSTGRTGNEILAAARQQAIEEGLTPSIYTHPIGFHGHAAGPTIGLWDKQEGVPGQGDYPLFANTAYSIELNVTVAMPEWDGMKIRIMLEEDAFFDGKTVRFIDPRQISLHLIH